MLVEEGLVSAGQLVEALARQDEAQKLGEILVRDKAITEEALEKVLKKQGPRPTGAEEDQTIRVETAGSTMS